MHSNAIETINKIVNSIDQNTPNSTDKTPPMDIRMLLYFADIFEKAVRENSTPEQIEQRIRQFRLASDAFIIHTIGSQHPEVLSKLMNYVTQTSNIF